jgi:hypothetical protein
MICLKFVIPTRARYREVDQCPEGGTYSFGSSDPSPKK